MSDELKASTARARRHQLHSREERNMKMSTQSVNRVLIVAACVSGILGCDSDPLPVEDTGDAVQDEDVDKQDEDMGNQEPLPACSPSDMASARMVSTRNYIRVNGKPTNVVSNFETLPEESVCVAVVTGSRDASGVDLSPAPASLSVRIDDIHNIADPSDVSAHSTLVTRVLASSMIKPGTHKLDVELRGKPGSLASVTVFASSADMESSVGPIAVSRLNEPTLEGTFLKDESIVVFMDGTTSSEEAALALAALPFPVMVVGTLDAVAIVRVYLPGVESAGELLEKIEAIGALPGVQDAGYHYVGGLQSSGLPSEGDSDYIGYLGKDEFKGAAWHLERIRAEEAWGNDNVYSSVRIGVIDSGFNVSHPGWLSNDGVQSNLESCYTPNSSGVLKSGPCADVAAQMEYQPNLGESCEVVPKSTLEKHHGTQVAGLIGARAENTVKGAADTLGVLWQTKLHLGQYNNAPLVPDDDSLLSAELAQCSAVKVSTDFSILLMAEEMAQADVKVINMSFELASLRDDGSFNSQVNVQNPSDWMDRVVSSHRARWTSFLGHKKYQELLIVQSAGNNGKHCTDAKTPSSFCSAIGAAYACSLHGTALDNRVLCVGASDKSNEITSLTNLGGDQLAAPGENIMTMSFDGGLKKTSGTSFSAPLVTGAAGLLLGEFSNLSPAMLHDIITTGGALSAIYDSKRYRILDLLAAQRQAYRCRDAELPDGCPWFPDIEETPNAWYYTPVNRLACNCIVKGHPNGDFKPGDAINVVEALKIVLEIAFPGESFDAPDGEEWFDIYVDYGNKLGVLDHLLQKGVLDPSASISRGDFVILLVKASELSTVEELAPLHDLYKKNVTPAVDEYTDLAYDSGDLSNHVYAATNLCLVEGHGMTGEFKPLSTLNRAEVSKIGCLAIYGFGNEQCGEDSESCKVKLP